MPRSGYEAGSRVREAKPVTDSPSVHIRKSSFVEEGFLIEIVDIACAFFPLCYTALVTDMVRYCPPGKRALFVSLTPRSLFCETVCGGALRAKGMRYSRPRAAPCY